MVDLSGHLLGKVPGRAECVCSPQVVVNLRGRYNLRGYGFVVE